MVITALVERPKGWLLVVLYPDSDSFCPVLKLSIMWKHRSDGCQGFCPVFHDLGWTMGDTSLEKRAPGALESLGGNAGPPCGR